MGKRRGDDAGIDMQVSKESYDVDSSNGPESSSSSPFTSMAATKADSSILQSRSIRKAKRRTNGPFASSSGGGGGGGLFANVNLTAGLSGASAPPAMPSSSSSSSSSAGLFGAANPVRSSLTALPAAPAESTPTEAANGASDRNGFLALSSSAGRSEASKSNEHLKRMAALNKSFCKWVDREMEKTEIKPLVDGVLEYIRYAAAEKEKEKSNQGATSSSAARGATGGGAAGDSGLFGSASRAAPGKSSASSTASIESGGSSSTSTTAPSGGSLFSSTPSNGGLFGSSSSGAPKPFDFSGGVKSSSSLFGSSSSSGAAAPKSGGLFGSSGVFGASSSSSSSGAGAGADDGDGEGDTAAQEGETKVEDSVRDDEIQVAKTRAKIFYLKDGSWASKGVGGLSLLQEKDSKRGYVVLRSDAGRITANIPLMKGMQTSVDEKAKSVRFAAVSYSEDADGNPAAENEGKITPFMIRVKTAQDASDLQAKIDSCVAEVP